MILTLSCFGVPVILGFLRLSPHNIINANKLYYNLDSMKNAILIYKWSMNLYLIIGQMTFLSFIFDFCVSGF